MTRTPLRSTATLLLAAIMLSVTTIACSDELPTAPTVRTMSSRGGTPLALPSLTNTLALPGIDAAATDIDMCSAISGLCGEPICPGESVLGSSSDKKGTGFHVSGCGNISKLIFRNIKAKMLTDVGVDVGISAPDVDVDPGCIVNIVHVPAIPGVPATPEIIGPFGVVIWPGSAAIPGVPAHDVEVHIPAGCDPPRPPGVSFTPPELGSVSAFIHPNFDVEVEVEAAGSGDVSLRIPIPKATVPAPPLALPLSPLRREFIGWGLGLYLVLEGRLTNTSTHFIVKVKNEFNANFGFTPSGGWTSGIDQGPFDVTASVSVESPDTTAFRYGIQPAVSLQIEPNREQIGTLLPGYELQLGVWADRFFENVFTASANGNLRNDANAGVKGRAYASFALIPPGEGSPCALGTLLTCDLATSTADAQPLFNLDKPFTCCATDMYEQYGVGQFRFTGNTTGETDDLDPDGYTLSWTRAGNSPEPYVDSVMTAALGTNGSAVYPDVLDWVSNLPSNPFGAFTITNCTVVHADGVIAVLSPGVGVIVPELRRTLPGLPNFSKIIGCASLPADYTLTVSGLAQNCTVQGQNPRVVTLRPLLNLTKLGAAFPISWTPVRDVTDIDVNVACRPLTGSLRVAATTTGTDFDSDGYNVSVDGSAKGHVDANGTLTVNGVRVGHHVAALNGLAFNCTAAPPNPVGADVAFETTVDATVAVSCTSAYQKACDIVKSALAAGNIGPTGIANSFCQKLRNADTARRNGDLAGVTDLMDGFAAELRAQRGKQVTTGVADQLLAAAAYIAGSGYFMP